MVTEKLNEYGAFFEVKGMLAGEFKFLARAVGDEPWRYFINYIKIEEVEPSTEERPYPILRGIATDGRRMHVVDPLDIKAGEYGIKPGLLRMVSCKSVVQLAEKVTADVSQYVNWRKVIPKTPLQSVCVFTGCDLKRRDGQSSLELSRLFRAFPVPTPLNVKYLEGLGFGYDWDVQWESERKGVVFKSGTMTAIIMPMNDD